MNRIEGIGKLMDYVEEMREEGINVCRPQVQQFNLLEMMLISKHYPLVKRLVDNDKIDRDKVGETEKKQIIRIQRTIENIKILRYTTLLMILAISNEPTNDLISYLK